MEDRAAFGTSICIPDDLEPSTFPKLEVTSTLWQSVSVHDRAQGALLLREPYQLITQFRHTKDRHSWRLIRIVLPCYAVDLRQAQGCLRLTSSYQHSQGLQVLC